jgi:hypothetical protein
MGGVQGGPLAIPFLPPAVAFRRSLLHEINHVAHGGKPGGRLGGTTVGGDADERGSTRSSAVAGRGGAGRPGATQRSALSKPR